MRFTKTLLTALAGIALIFAALPAHAVDGDYFSISGTVTDANWNPIPGALVILYDNDFNQVTTQDTTSNGYFAFEGVSVKTNLCNLRISYKDAEGTVHELPGYYIPSQTAHGTIELNATMTHYDDYALPGSQPRATPTPVPTPTPAPTTAPTADPVPQNDNGLYLILFFSGFLTGASMSLLACIVFMRPRKPAN